MSGDKKSFEVKISVPFFDLDPMQIVWHGNYLNYFEDARRALLDHMGVDLYQYYERTGIVFPIIRTATKHIYPLRYGDEFVCKATLVDSRFKIVVDFEIRLAGDRALCAKGSTEQVAVRVPEMEMAFSIPEEIAGALGA